MLGFARSHRALSGRLLRAFGAGALCASVAHAASVRGTFVGGTPPAPLEGVEVVLRRAANSTVVAHTTTGADGRFRVDSLRFDHYLFRASLVGYQPWQRSDVVLNESAPDLDLGRNTLTVSPIAMKGIDVASERATVIVAPDRNIYLTKDMPAATTGNATDVLRSVPELDVDIDGRVSIRGSTSVTIQFNGRVTPLKGDDLTNYLRQMSGNRIEKVEVVANPSAKYDPEGMAGIVNIVLKDQVDLGLSGSFNFVIGGRYSSPGARVAYQKGPLTVSGGVSGSLNRWAYGNSVLRQSHLTSPSSTYASASDFTFRGLFGNADGSFDYTLTKRATLYGTINGFLGSNETHGQTGYVLNDSTNSETSRYLRADDYDWNGHTPSVTLGLQHVIQAGRNERSIELLQSGSLGDNASHGLRQTVIPVGIDDQLTQVAGDNDYRERSLQMDDTHPLGKKGKLELGYKGMERTTTNASGLVVVGGPAGTPATDDMSFQDRERFHSAYLTLGSVFGPLSTQLGARGELADREFDSRSSGVRYDHDYQSLFPSANVAWDFGKGRTLRFIYSKRIERPSAYMLNPDALSTDSLNRYVGNPYLGPKFTHSYSIDANWTGSAGLLKLSPYFRDTYDNWDYVSQVDANGASVGTWMNASSVRVLGVTFTASLRQQGKLGGTVSVGVSRDHHDASNLSQAFLHDVVGWSANGNVTYKLRKTLDLQAYLRYSPKRALAQGYASSYVGSTLGARWKPNDRVSAGLTINDPFNLTHFSSATGDATYSQVQRQNNNMRSVSASLSWSWGGKPPEQKQRRQSSDQPQQEGAPGQ
jgi:outer membrane receptor for ferrienterochelin and colicin